MGTIGEAVRRRRSALRSGLTGRFLDLGLIVVVAAFLILLATRVLEHGPSFFLQILTFAIANGGIYALIALGYTMVYGIIELINFAHGDVFAFGAFLSASLIPVFGLGEDKPFGVLPALALLGVFVVTMLVCGVLNVSIERIAYRPLRHAPRLAPLITAIGMSFFLEGALFLWKGPSNVHYPNVLPSAGFNLFGAEIGTKEIIVIVTALVLVVALALFVERSRLGKAMRATAQDRDASLLMGIDIDQTIAATFFIGALLAGAGGTMYGLYYNTSVFDLGFSAGLVAFTAAVFGGIGNIYGAAIGGLLIGMIQSFWDGYFESAWTQVVIFAVLILVLVFRPTGILGMRVPEK
ncbi:MAG: branched-chain amino acid ABC transporter permease [Chloroflexi bacterium]|nr:MAG: branched-chain amino acid ABC transporter permease [Chloroflexota bacterium]TMG69550.1 MAG: branched-chain amino acid ABC transporter permease [Chloroflexota bacterium]